MVYRFDQFEIDDREFRFSDDHSPVSVEPKALRLLIYLIQNRSRLVRKQELLDKVWPDAMVTESALTREIVLLRKALSEDSRVPRYIETVPTVGYRFVAKVTALEQPAEAAAAPEKSILGLPETQPDLDRRIRAPAQRRGGCAAFGRVGSGGLATGTPPEYLQARPSDLYRQLLLPGIFAGWNEDGFWLDRGT